MGAEKVEERFRLPEGNAPEYWFLLRLNTPDSGLHAPLEPGQLHLNWVNVNEPVGKLTIC